MSAESLALYSGVVLSLVFSYVPGLSTKYAALSDTAKKLIMLGMLALVSVLVVVAACTGFAEDLGIYVTCDRDGFVGVVKAFMLALIANQSALKISPVTNAVKEAKYYSLAE